MKRVTLSVSLQDPVGKEQKRLVVVLEVEASRVSGREAAEVLGLSFPYRIPWERQVRRLIAAYRKEGAVNRSHVANPSG